MTRADEGVAALEARMGRSEEERRGLWARSDEHSAALRRLEAAVERTCDEARERREESRAHGAAIAAEIAGIRKDLATLTREWHEARVWARALRWAGGIALASGLWVVSEAPRHLAAWKAWRGP